MKRILSIIVFLVVSLKASAQLDPLYNQYLMNQSMVNPAYIGVYRMGHVSAISRAQWLGVDGAPMTHTLSFYNAITNHSSVGITAISDTYGINSNLDILAAYAYRLDMGGNSSLTFGLHGMFSSYTQDFNKLDVEIGGDPAVGSGMNTFSQTNFGFGMMYKNDFFYLGAASPRMQEMIITQDGAVVATYQPSYNVSAGMLISASDAIKVKPSVLARYQNDELAIDINGQLNLNEKFWLGVTSRNFSSGGVNFIYRHLYIYHFGYSFEFPFGDIGRGNAGIHEIMLSVDLKLGDQQEIPDRFF